MDGSEWCSVENSTKFILSSNLTNPVKEFWEYVYLFLLPDNISSNFIL